VRKVVAIAVLFISSIAAAAETLPRLPDDLLLRLDHEEWSVRQAATEELAEYPLEWAGLLLKMAATEENAELQYRFRLAAKAIYYRRVVYMMTEYRRQFGTLDVNAAYVYRTESDTIVKKALRYMGFQRPIGYMVTKITDNGVSSGKLLLGDVIVEIEGPNHNGLGRFDDFVADSDYELTIRRYKNIEKLRQRGTFTDEEEFMTVKVTIRAGWSDLDPGNNWDRPKYARAIEIETESWERFKKEHEVDPDVHPTGIP
jgi:hypothetical protein